MMRQLVIIPLLWFGFAGAMAAQQTSSLTPTGAIRGWVLDETGKPVFPARVFIHQTLPAGVAMPAAPPVITGPRIAAADTDSNGQFVAFLPAGTYIACGETATQGLLDPCRWSTSAPTFTIKSQTTVETQIVMAKGAVVPVHVNDPSQLLPPVTSAVQAECRFQMVTAAGRRYDAIIVAHTSTSRDHAITIPFGTPLSLQVACPQFAINDSTGKPAAAAGVATLAPAGSTVATLSYTVSGVKQ
jgi:hypothetical protein